jgi:hypothetical protein
MDSGTRKSGRGRGPLIVIAVVAAVVLGASLAGALWQSGTSEGPVGSAAASGETLPSEESSAASAPSTSPPVALADPNEVYDPVLAGEELPRGFRPLLARDQIEPVYEPVFTSAARVDWPADSLVIGVAGAETAKAYPVTHLNSREMVIDSLEGIPILVTW